MEAKGLDVAKIEVEIGKLMAETMKLHAESVKLRRETRWYPVVWSCAVLGTLVTVTKLLH